MHPSISVIVPAYNAEKTIRDCLKNIIDETKDFTKEIIVIDDCSTDRTFEKVKEFTDVKIIKLDSNQGVGFARSYGAKVSNYNTLVYVDSDVIVLKDSIKLIVDYLDKEKVGSTGAIQKLENLNKDAWSSNFVCLKSCYGYEEQSNFIEASNIQSEFCAITKEFLQSIKGWKHYKGAGGEEYALGYKINLAGKKNILIKKAKYATYYQSLYKRFLRIIDRTEKYIEILFEKKKFDSKGSFATSGQALSSFFTGVIILSLIFSLILKDLYFIPIILLLFQTYIEFNFLRFANKYFGIKMLVFSFLGIHVINLGIILGALLYIIKKLKNLSLNLFKND